MLQTQFSLRTAAIGCRLQPNISSPCAYHTSSAQSQESKPARRRLIQRTKSVQPPSQLVRHSSTTSPVDLSSSTVNSTHPPSTAILNWNEFFKLRKRRRRVQLSASIGTSFLSMTGGAGLIAASDMDAIVGQIPLDPFVTLGLMTFSCGGVGWLLGPIVGTSLFNLFNSKSKGEMIVKEKEFYDRIKRHRVDPSASSIANPVPDYYGEKISSVGGYRQWLKDQRAFTKKRQTITK